MIDKDFIVFKNGVSACRIKNPKMAVCGFIVGKIIPF